MFIERLFLKVLHMGFTSGYLILAVIVARFLLKKAPKNMACILWAVVGLRLLCPFPILSAFSLAPEQTASFTSRIFLLERESDTWNDASLQLPLSDTDARLPPAARQPVQSAMPASKAVRTAVLVWMAGFALMAAYFAFSFCKIRGKVSQAIPSMKENIRFYRCDCISVPFLFGFPTPKIYVPFSISGQELSYVLKHELAHKSRCDHLTKIVGYLILSVYWFQPLVWVSYLLYGQDMELACDEKVVKEIGEENKKGYAQALLSCSTNRKAAVYPVAFGQIGVKKRVKHILNYKKPGIWAILAAAFLCTAITVCFATESGRKGIAQNEIAPDAAKNSQISAQKADAAAKCVENWAKAFCGRDAKTIYGMLNEAGKKQFADAGMLDGEHSFGWSSPWPWEPGLIDDRSNYRILSVGNGSAKILYYAWTSDPHVTVWAETITYQYEDKTKQITIQDASFETMDEIQSADQFFTAYPNGEINGTRMDYVNGNGAGEALRMNALLHDNAKIFKSPDTSAMFLLNIKNDPLAVKTAIRERDGETIVTFTFLKDNRSVSVKMIRPLGESDIWIPQTA